MRETKVISLIEFHKKPAQRNHHSCHLYQNLCSICRIFFFIFLLSFNDDWRKSLTFFLCLIYWTPATHTHISGKPKMICYWCGSFNGEKQRLNITSLFQVLTYTNPWRVAFNIFLFFFFVHFFRKIWNWYQRNMCRFFFHSKSFRLQSTYVWFVIIQFVVVFSRFCCFDHWRIEHFRFEF